jgi:DNA polymerase-3 subunit beta
VKIRIDQASLAAATNAAAKAIPNRPPVPILGCALITAKASGELTVSGFDYTTSVTSTVECAADKDAAFAVSGRVLAQLCKDLPSGAVTVELDGGSAVVRGRGVRYRLMTLNTDEYPAVPVPPAPVVEVDAGALLDVLEQSLHAASTDQSLPALTGARLTFADGALQVACTDRYRLAVASTPVKGEIPAPESMLLNARELGDVARQFTGTVGIGWDDYAVVSFSDGATVATLTRMPGEFPKIDTFLSPPPAVTTMLLDIADLTEAARRGQQIISAGKRPLQFKAEAEGVTYSAAGSFDEHVDGELAAEVDGPPAEFGINPSYLLDALKGRRGDRVHVAATSPTRPLHFTFPGDDRGVAVLMPIRYSNAG